MHSIKSNVNLSGWKGQDIETIKASISWDVFSSCLCKFEHQPTCEASG